MTASTTPPCDFCKGRPVANAARWTAPGQPMYAPCPRCGSHAPEPTGPRPDTAELELAELAPPARAEDREPRYLESGPIHGGHPSTPRRGYGKCR